MNVSSHCITHVYVRCSFCCNLLPSVSRLYLLLSTLFLVISFSHPSRALYPWPIQRMPICPNISWSAVRSTHSVSHTCWISSLCPHFICWPCTLVNLTVLALILLASFPSLHHTFPLLRHRHSCHNALSVFLHTPFWEKYHMLNWPWEPFCCNLHFAPSCNFAHNFTESCLVPCVIHVWIPIYMMYIFLSFTSSSSLFIPSPNIDFVQFNYINISYR